MSYKYTKDIKGYIIQIGNKTVHTEQTFLYQILRKMKNGYSPIIGICGCQQIGKSFTGLWLAHLIYKIYNKPFNPENITFYEPEAAIRDLENKKNEVIFVDEASDIMGFREWYQQTHLALNSMINTQAFRNNLYIFITPYLVHIDKALRLHLDYKIWVKDRGKFIVWRYKKRYYEEEARNATHPKVIDYCFLPKESLDPKLWERYKRFSILKKTEIKQKRHAKLLEKGKYEGNILDMIKGLGYNGN